MKKSILFASLVIMTSTVLGMSRSNRRSIPSDGFGEQQQGRKVRILEEASTSQTPNIQSVRDNRDVEKLTRYLFDLISELLTSLISELLRLFLLAHLIV